MKVRLNESVELCGTGEKRRTSASHKSGTEKRMAGEVIETRFLYRKDLRVTGQQMYRHNYLLQMAAYSVIYKPLL